MRQVRMASAAVLVVLASLGAVLVPGATGWSAPRPRPFPMPIGITSAPSRSVAASGQVIEFQGGGCTPGANNTNVSLFAGAAPDVDNERAVASGASGQAADGSFVVPLVLLQPSDGSNGFEHLPDGPYVAVTWCVVGGDWTRSEAQPITVSGSKPSFDIAIDVAAYYGTFDLVGGSCPGADVSLHIFGGGTEVPGDEQAVDATVATGPDGSWSYHWEGPTLGPLVIEPSCGDPAGEGFRYPVQVAEIAYYVPPTTSTTSTSTTVVGSTTTTSSTTPSSTSPQSAPAAAAVPIAALPGYTG